MIDKFIIYYVIKKNCEFIGQIKNSKDVYHNHNELL